jgi:magnesium chelatase family protein
MTHRQTRQSCGLDEECQNQLKAAMTALGLSARGHDKVLRSDAIKPGQFDEAVNYRMLDRHLWT